MRRIVITYDVVDVASTETGEPAETGWIDLTGEEIIPDEGDIDEHENEFAAVVAMAIKVITDQGGVGASSYPTWCRGTWYTQIDPDISYADGSETRFSYHLKDFLDEEAKAIYAKIA